MVTNTETHNWIRFTELDANKGSALKGTYILYQFSRLSDHCRRRNRNNVKARGGRMTIRD